MELFEKTKQWLNNLNKFQKTVVTIFIFLYLINSFVGVEVNNISNNYLFDVIIFFTMSIFPIIFISLIISYLIFWLSKDSNNFYKLTNYFLIVFALLSIITFFINYTNYIAKKNKSNYLTDINLDKIDWENIDLENIDLEKIDLNK